MTTYELWYAVLQWAQRNGYVFENPGQEGSRGRTGAEAVDADGFRLPTNEEWELASRYQGTGGSSGSLYLDGMYWTPGSWASGATADTADAAAVGAVAWYRDNSGGITAVSALSVSIDRRDVHTYA